MWSAAWGLGLRGERTMEKTVLLYLGSSFFPSHASFPIPFHWGSRLTSSGKPSFLEPPPLLSHRSFTLPSQHWLLLKSLAHEKMELRTAPRELSFFLCWSPSLL